jgi:hypothetical protein
MSSIRTLQRSFAGGEITPELYGRIDLTKYQTGLAHCENFIILPHGPAANRPGTKYLAPTKDSTKKSRLIPFAFSTTQTYALEFGNLYIRVFTQSAQLLTGTVTGWVTATGYIVGDIRSNAGTNYYCAIAHTSGVFATDLGAGRWVALTGNIVEIPSPYVEADLFDLHYVQSADVLTIVHPNYAPRELRRLGAVNWALTTISFAPSIAAPTSVTATATVAVGPTITYYYVVTSISSDGLEESVASSSSSCVNTLSTAGNYNTITWTNASGAVRYNVYKAQSGIYGYIGQGSTGASGFIDNNITPDMTVTPPETQAPFTGTGNYPGAASYFEQRRCFAGTTNKPQNIWMTRSGTESNLNYSIPTQDSDAIVVKVAAREANTIRHLVPLSDLIMLTSGGEWKCSAGNSDALTPLTINVKPQTYTGANNVQPVVTGSSVLYAQDRGAGIRELSYSWEVSSYKTIDAGIMVPHYFTGKLIKDMAYTRAPNQVLWSVRDDGVLLGMTYVPDQQVMAWHQHTTDGYFESVCAIAEGSEDVLYCVVKRNINGNDVRYVERLASRTFTNLEDAFFVDCGLTYSGAAATTISGLDHLEGEEVAVLADGAVITGLTVVSGDITIPVAATPIHIGLPITATMETLPIAFETQGYGQGRAKNVSAAHLRVYRSSGIFIGPDTSKLVEFKQRTSEPWGSPPTLKSDEIEVVLSSAWSSGGQLVIQHSDPLPLTIVSLSLDAAIGG